MRLPRTQRESALSTPLPTGPKILVVRHAIRCANFYVFTRQKGFHLTTPSLVLVVTDGLLLASNSVHVLGQRSAAILIRQIHVPIKRLLILLIKHVLAAIKAVATPTLIRMMAVIMKVHHGLLTHLCCPIAMPCFEVLQTACMGGRIGKLVRVWLISCKGNAPRHA